MNITHSIFKRKQKFHKLLISAVAILLAVCMLPTSVFADEVKEYIDPIYTSNGTQGEDVIGNGGGWNPSVYNVHQSTSGLWHGYRIYMVDNNGYVIQQPGSSYYVVDIYTRNMFQGGNVTKGTTLRINKGNITVNSIPAMSINTLNNKTGNALTLSDSNAELGLTAAGSNCKNITLYTLGSSGYGLHLYKSSDHNSGDPIHTVNPVDPTPSDPNDPITPETPQKTDTPNFDNTGSSTIIKVYGEIYKDGSTVYHINDKATYSETQTTDWIVIEDESKYKLQQWVVSNGTVNFKGKYFYEIL